MPKQIYFAGGGTGGHIYPAVAVAQQLLKVEPTANITFFCSDREIDSKILSKTAFEFIPLSAVGFSANPIQLTKFLLGTHKSYKKAKQIIGEKGPAVLIGVGGFVSTGPILAAHKLGIPVQMLNTDSVPGKANKFLARYVDGIYVQFEQSRSCFGSNAKRVVVTGCPVRAEFAAPDKNKAIKELRLDISKKILLITGASSGARSINNAICSVLNKLVVFSDDWQIVHLTGHNDFETVKLGYKDCEISYKVIDYYDDMANLLAAAHLVIGRAGAVSVAEYAAAGVPSICMPYPYHKDNHQRKNAEELVKTGCAIILEDKIDPQLNAQALWPQLEKLLNDGSLLDIMRQNANRLAQPLAAEQIAKRILQQTQ